MNAKIPMKGNLFGKLGMTPSEETKVMKKARTLLYMSSMIFFGLSIVLIVIGICYLTAWRHEYSFSYFNLTTMAGFFLAFGIIILLLSILSVFSINTERGPIIIISTIVILTLFVAVLIMGIWALSVNGADVVQIDSRTEMIDSIRRYDERNLDRYETRRMNWLQTRFVCCGIDSYNDWRTLFLYGGQYSPNRYVDQWTINNNMPYIDHVPDSCCIYPQYNCGKQFRFNQDMGMLSRNNVINTKGCLNVYLTCLSKDLVFNGALAVAIAAVALVIGGIMIAYYLIIRSRYM